MGFDKGTCFTFGLAVVCILLTLVAINAQAEDTLPQPQPVAAEATAKITDPAQSLISRQLEAIKTRDADLAWSLTTDSFHSKFDGAKEFLSHLRFQVRPIYNHSDIEFLDQYGSQDSLTQKVKMKDRYGKPVTVVYRLKQQQGEWRIDSFAILPLDAEPI